MMKFIEKYSPSAITQHTINEYNNKIFGFDANLLIYKLVYGIRTRGYDIKNNEKNVTHIHALILKLLAFKRHKINALFVFDNTAPEMKYHTLDLRKEIKDNLANKHKNIDNEKSKRIYYYAKSDISDTEFDDCKELIKIFGFNYIDAKMEADPQLVKLYKNNIIDYIVSDDLDILLFGGNIIKNFSVDKKKKFQEINLDKLLLYANINHDQLIYIGILMGTDYSNGKTFSPTKAYNIINNNNDETKQILKNKQFIDIHNYYKYPPVYNICQKYYANKIDRKKLSKFLIKHEFNDKYINKLYENIDNIDNIIPIV